MSREVRLYLVPHLPKNSNCTTMLMARRVVIMLSRMVGLYLAPHLSENSNCTTMLMARKVEMMLGRVVGRSTKDQESQFLDELFEH